MGEYESVEIIKIVARISGKEEEFYAKARPYGDDTRERFLLELINDPPHLIEVYNCNNRRMVINTSTILQARSQYD